MNHLFRTSTRLSLMRMRTERSSLFRTPLRSAHGGHHTAGTYNELPFPSGKWELENKKVQAAYNQKLVGTWAMFLFSLWFTWDYLDIPIFFFLPELPETKCPPAPPMPKCPPKKTAG